MRLKAETKKEIEKEYNNRVYGYRLGDYKTLFELNELYEQVLNLKSKKAKKELIVVIKKRALIISDKETKKVIKKLFSEKIENN